MKKFSKICIAVIVLLLLSYFVYKIVHKIQFKEQVAENTATIPQFNFQTVSHKGFSKQNIADTLGRVILQLFSPDCEHCQYMAQSIVKNKTRLQGAEILMVTPFGDSSSVAQFAKTYGLDSLSNVHLLLDTKDEFYNIFGSSLVPSFYVYKNNRLVKSIKGETRIDNLLAD
ncbi:peroxiredoxin family protein [Arachidicoccus sp.]|uniref:peroxiredoxin family protein n=1 Tax=Arachidicoccus sp. TaxID=1872624 RepID=UPI003D1CC095